MLSRIFKQIGFSVIKPDTDDLLHADARLEVRHFDLWIGDQPILKDISLQIPEHKITCIIGPSGCGKSTLLKVSIG